MKITGWLLDLVTIDLTQFNDEHGSCDVDSWTNQPISVHFKLASFLAARHRPRIAIPFWPQ